MRQAHFGLSTLSGISYRNLYGEMIARKVKGRIP